MEKSIMDEIIEKIQKAEEEAYLEGIETNAIVLNEDHTLVKQFYLTLTGPGEMGELSVRQVPPMILGKRLFLGPLPDEFDFALTHVETNEETEAVQLMRLIKKYVHVVNGQLVFKKISYKKNAEDFGRILDLLGKEDEYEND